MQALHVLCLFPLLFGTISSVVNLDEHVIVLGPSRSTTPTTRRVIDHAGHDDHTHEDIHSTTHEDFHNTTDGNITVTTQLSNATDAVNSTLEFEEDDDYSTHEQEVDETGCQLRIRDEMERRCFVKFEDTVSASLHITVAEESEKAVCCALEGYEKCCYKGYRDAGCNTDKDSLKETLKAARIFLGAVTKNSCSVHRGKCSFSSGYLPMSSFLLTSSAALISIIAIL